MGIKLSIVGGGKMGEALLGGLIASKWAEPNEISIIEPDESRLKELQGKYEGAIFSKEILPSAKFLLAVKPQIVTSICQQLAEMKPELVISIAAGVTTRAIEKELPEKTPVIRVMPNTPSMIGKGMAAIAAGSSAGKDHLDWASSILSAVGEVVVVDETTLDAVTGLSGSGPAYLFLLAEAMIASGIENGLDPTVADVLTRQTLLGASSLLSSSGVSPSDLRDSVTSPNGTTAAAIDHLDKNQFTEIIIAAISKATSRSKELGE
ncbi:MAG: hypothetical protein MB53_02760 [marine actinobacterium MedAcidi-G2A]|nr:MAG: hypothetical protein MB53_02760 [marine actinobacterium MedAcidi-G2A]